MSPEHDRIDEPEAPRSITIWSVPIVAIGIAVLVLCLLVFVAAELLVRVITTT